MERTIGIEPILPVSKTGALSIGRHAHIKQDTFSFQSYSLNLLNFAVCILKPQDVAVGVEPTREPRGHSRSPVMDSTFTNSVTLSSAVNYSAVFLELRRELESISGGRLTSRLPSDFSDHPLSRRCRALARLIFRVGCGRRIRTSDLQGMNLLLYLAELSRVILVGGDGNAPRGNFISQQCQRIYSPPRWAPPEISWSRCLSSNQALMLPKHVCRHQHLTEKIYKEQVIRFELMTPIRQKGMFPTTPYLLFADLNGAS